MAQGSPTPEDTVSRFRAHYIYSGNAAESARAVGIEERTGRDIAQRANNDPEFAALRRSLRAQDLEDCIQARRRVREAALKRFERDADRVPEPGEIDKGSDYGKLVLDAEKNAQALARFDAERDGIGTHTGPAVVINLTGEAEIANPDPEPTSGS